MKADVLAGLRKPEAAPAAKPAAAARAGEITPDGKEILDTLPYSGVRRIIGDRLSSSWQAAPHVFFTAEVQMDKVIALRKDVNAAQEHKTSVTDFIAVAVVKALAKYPDVNAMLDGDRILRFKSINIGVAVAAENGLIVPVVKNAHAMTLIEVSRESARLVEKARSGKLVPPDYSGGTFTISNLGMFGIDQFTAIINPPEAGILAVSATVRKPVAQTDASGKEEVVIRSMMQITLSADHRVIDGLLAAQFIGEIRRQLENPLGLLL
jgi:pyruvate dehydrogenase E2 component (dihydrolipoamide acetyltransferase)